MATRLKTQAGHNPQDFQVPCFSIRTGKCAHEMLEVATWCNAAAPRLFTTSPFVNFKNGKAMSVWRLTTSVNNCDISLRNFGCALLVDCEPSIPARSGVFSAPIRDREPASRLGRVQVFVFGHVYPPWKPIRVLVPPAQIIDWSFTMSIDSVAFQRNCKVMRPSDIDANHYF